MEKMMHMAAQYLAAAGISFLEKQADDSHTNLGFSSEERSLSSRPLDASGTLLILNYDDFTLEWKNSEGSTKFQLNGANHKEVLDWLKEMAVATGFRKPYVYSLHYELPYSITPDFRFEQKSASELKELAKMRILSQTVLTNFLEAVGLDSEIRVWSHHFDTGAFASLADGSGKAIGMGLAIPDSVCNEHYFYSSGYLGHDVLSSENFSKLSVGEWRTEGFMGAILPISKADASNATNFFKEALTAYKG